LKSLVSAVALGAAALMSAGTARADGTTDALALKQFDEGRAAYEKGDFANALKAFQQSLQNLPSPNTRLYIARCQKGLGKIASASTSYQLAAREAADRLSVTGEKRYSATRDAAQAEAAEIDKSVPHLTIVLPADAPDTTTIQLDDASLARSALSALAVDPGSHALTVAAPRRTPFQQSFALAAADQKTISVALTRLPTATIHLALKTRPAGVEVELDGKPVDPAALGSDQLVDAGAHRLVVRAPGYRDFEWKQSLADEQTASVEVALEPGTSSAVGGTHGPPKWLVFAVAGVGVVTLGVGTYFALNATSRANTEKGKDPLTRDATEQGSIKNEATVANVLFISGAAVLGVAGALAFVTEWKPKSNAGAYVTPTIGIGTVGAEGRF
jgi:hypothetical protein